MATTVKELIEELQGLAREHGEDLEIVTRTFSHGADDWDYPEGCSAYVEDFKAPWWHGTTGKKLVFDTP